VNKSRRAFVKTAGSFGLALPGLKAGWSQPGGSAARPVVRADLGPIVADPELLLDLPKGFEYTVFSTIGEEMDDGFFVPGLHDGMAAFPGDDGKTILVRNHEMTAGVGGAFGEQNERLEALTDDQGYDLGHRTAPCLGGTTTLVYDTSAQQLVSHHLSLACTLRNCAGGPTPWGSWVTCEEAVSTAGGTLERDHGYNFEVPATTEGLAVPRPLEAMGRFNHEAIAVDVASGVVYQTEDRPDSLFYRYIPEVPGELASGGQLQALRIHNVPSLDTRNWHGLTHIAPGNKLEVRWVDIDEVHAPADDLRYQGFLKGAARFARGEGLWAAGGVIYFVCTSGGPVNRGQVWRYTPSPEEGKRGERREPATLELFVESSDPEQIDMCDNLTVSPWGDLILCEDGADGNRLVGVTPAGEVYPFAFNARSGHEFAGATFSPDGTTLFVNIQGLGLTIAIVGPWPVA
jgi:secreted PhoX family phosphatase